MNSLKKEKLGSLIISLLYLVLGFCIILFPTRSLETICFIVGIIAAVIGLYKTLFFFLRHHRNYIIWLDLISGLFSLLAGILLMLHPTFITNLFPVIIGILVIIDSAFKLQTSLNLRKKLFKNWWSLFFIALAGLVLGFLLVIHPFEANKVALILVGISLLLNGIQNLLSLFYTVKIKKNNTALEADFIDISDSSYPTNETKR